MLTLRKRRILFWLSIIIFLALVPFTVLYSLGYRFDSDFQLRKTGGLYIAANISGSEIFINSEFQKKTNLLQSGVFVQNLSPASYQLLVARDNYLPWSKELKVSSQLVTEARALLLPKDTNGQVLLRGPFTNLKASPFDPILLLTETRTSGNTFSWYLPETNEFLSPDPGEGALSFKDSFEIIRWHPRGIVLKLDKRILRLSFNLTERAIEIIPLGEELQERTVQENKKFLERLDKREISKVYWDSAAQELRAKWLKDEPLPYYFLSEEQILLKTDSLRNFEFFPKRKDVILAAFANGIWAIELDGRDQRIIQPLYKGKRPYFALLPSGEKVYILDEGLLFRASLFARE